ncbi:unnamed protein product [Schistosoma curassoni]|uniref:Inner membrane protein n=1 Tax=Schistosoma curassoni TaxID=6186 RepID=A0A183JCC3_9TREM|nr:unnamed protein product [Schistosoma curassoni]
MELIRYMVHFLIDGYLLLSTGIWNGLLCSTPRIASIACCNK